MKKIIITLWILSCYQISFSQLIKEWEIDGAYELTVSNTGDFYTANSGYDSELESSFYRFSKYTTDANLLWNTEKYYRTPVQNTTNIIRTAIDPEGNLYAVFNVKEVALNLSDMRILKYSSDGVLIWSELFSVEESFIPDDIAVDSSGNIYITGNTFENIPDIITMKYSTDGTLIWDERYSSSGMGGWDCGFAIAVDNEGNVCVVGSTTGFMTQDDYITIKYSPDGTQLWAHNYNGDGSFGSWLDDWPADITVDNSGNIYVTGYSEISEHSAHGIATIKYSPEGYELWVSRYDYGEDKNEEDEYGRAEILTDTKGNVYVTGYNYGGLETGNDMVTIKYSSNGTQLWANRYNVSENDDDYAHALVLDNKGNVYVTGGRDWTNIYVHGDLVTIEYDSVGNLIWIDKHIDEGLGYDIAIDQDQNIYVKCFKIIKYRQSQGTVSTPIFDPATNTNAEYIKIYPNPAKNMIFINGFTNKNAIINIFNLEGKLVLQQIKTINNVKIDITDLTQGIYFLQILENDKLSTQKLIIK